MLYLYPSKVVGAQSASGHVVPTEDCTGMDFYPGGHPMARANLPRIDVLENSNFGGKFPTRDLHPVPSAGNPSGRY